MDDFLYNKSADDEICQCPFHFHARKFLKLPTKQNQYASNGQNAHEGMRQLYQGEMTFEAMLETDWEEDVKTWISRGMALDPIPLEVHKTALFEAHIYIDEKGKATLCIDEKGKHNKVPKGAIAHGFIDELIPEYEGACHVIDWKTSYKDEDNLAERHLYAWLGHAYTKQNEVVFARYNIRNGTRFEWRYHFTKTGVSIVGPDGLMTAESDEFQNPILNYIKRRLSILLQVEPLPRPGAHCESWYGTPCDFLGTDCPAAASAQPVVAEMTQLDAPMLKGIAKGEVALTIELASQVLSGVFQMEGFLKALREQIKSYAAEAGPILVGETQYGIKTIQTNNVHKAKVLSALVDAGLSITAIAKLIKIEAASLRKADFSAYEGLKDAVEQCITPRGNQTRFGALDSKEAE